MKKIVNLSLRFTGYLFLLSLIWKGWEASSVYAEGFPNPPSAVSALTTGQPFKTALEPLLISNPYSKNPEAVLTAVKYLDQLPGFIQTSTQRCQSAGDDANGTTLCTKDYDDFSSARLESHHETLGDAFKKQTLIFDFNPQNRLTHKKSIREKLSYHYAGADQKLRAKFIDIVNRPADAKISREIMIYEYYPNGQVQKVVWTYYEQIENSSEAELKKHVLLRYNEDGTPQRGKAEIWAEGQRFPKRFFDWNQRIEPANFNHIQWSKWERWVSRVLEQAYVM